MLYDKLPRIFAPCEFPPGEQAVQQRSDALHLAALRYAQRLYPLLSAEVWSAALAGIHRGLEAQVNAVAERAGVASPYSKKSIRKGKSSA